MKNLLIFCLLFVGCGSYNVSKVKKVIYAGIVSEVKEEAKPIKLSFPKSFKKVKR
jgi:hypothetical protein